MPARLTALTILLGALTIAGSQRAVARDQAPAVAPNPDAVALESLRASSMLDWKGDQQRVGYANMDTLAPGNVIRLAAQPGQLPESLRDFSTFTYSLKGTMHGLDHFMRAEIAATSAAHC